MKKFKVLDGWTEKSDNQILELVRELRSYFKQEYSKNIANFYREDYDLIFESESSAVPARFLVMMEFDVKKTAKLVNECFLKRKTDRVRAITEEECDEPMLNMFREDAKDAKGNSLLIMDVKSHIKYDTKSGGYIRQKNAILFICERLFEKNVNENQLSILLDFTGSGITSIDLNISRFIVDVFKNYFPAFLGVFLLYKAPWIMNGAINTIKLLIPNHSKNLIKSVDEKTIDNYVNEATMKYLSKDDPQLTYA
ncbi:hypothetical protein SNEBB_006659 [Seison nebaliae]|nr:hypothetical protein SNEBB_006659 [Seison nebaliae]